MNSTTEKTNLDLREKLGRLGKVNVLSPGVLQRHHEQAIRQAEVDTKRLDWVLEHCDIVFRNRNLTSDSDIDKAMK